MKTLSVNKRPPSSSEKQHATAASSAIESPTDDHCGSNPTEELIATNDPNIVVFDGPGDPENPQHWQNRYKYMLVGLLSAMQTMV
jgi:hypothetical protein